MSTRLDRAALPLLLLACALGGCSSDVGARSTPRPAATEVAVRQETARDEPCGTAEHPCVLPALRVNGAARD